HLASEYISRIDRGGGDSKCRRSCGARCDGSRCCRGDGYLPATVAGLSETLLCRSQSTCCYPPIKIRRPETLAELFELRTRSFPFQFVQRFEDWCVEPQRGQGAKEESVIP